LQVVTYAEKPIWLFSTAMIALAAKGISSELVLVEKQEEVYQTIAAGVERSPKSYPL
jgi:hypothetical protein